MAHSLESLKRMRKDMGTQQLEKVEGQASPVDETRIIRAALEKLREDPSKQKVFIATNSPEAPKPEDLGKIGLAAYEKKLNKWKEHREKKQKIFEDKVATFDYPPAKKEGSKSKSKSRSRSRSRSEKKRSSRSSSGKKRGQRKAGTRKLG